MKKHMGSSEKKTYSGSDIMPGGYLLTQSALLFAYYGMHYDLPWWVLWFPTLLVPVFIGIVIAVMIIVAIVTGLVGD